MVVGCILCVVVTVQVLWRPHPVKAVHRGWTGLAYITSGLLAGVVGMGGPPLVLWSMAHDWSTQKTRGFMFATFATSIPFQIVLLGLTFGTSILSSAAAGVASLPLVWLGAAVGLPIGNRMAKGTLRHIAYAILLIIGVSAVVPSVLSWLR
jgi:uncharacterized membrane protein YfcA